MAEGCQQLNDEEEDEHRSDDDLGGLCMEGLFSLSLSASSNGLITLIHVDWGSFTWVLLVMESTLPTESIAHNSQCGGCKDVPHC